QEGEVDVAEVVDLAVVAAATGDALVEHRGHGMVSGVDVAARGVAAVEYRQVLNLAVVARRLVKTREGLAEVDSAVLRVASGCGQIDLEQGGVAVHQHRDRACALGRLPARADGVLGDVGAHDDGEAPCAVGREIPQCGLEAVDPAEARVLELGNLAVPRELRTTLRHERVVDHALDDDGAGGVVAARLGTESEHPDPRRIDVVVAQQAPDRIGRQGVDALARTAHPERPPDDTLHSTPGVIVPRGPVLEPNSIVRQVEGQATNSRHQYSHSRSYFGRNWVPGAMSILARLAVSVHTADAQPDGRGHRPPR